MKTTTFIVLIAIAIPAIALITSFAYTIWQIDEVHTIEAHVQVASYFGMNRNTDKLYLGTVKPPGSAFRNFTVKNNLDETRRIRIRVTGSHEEFATIYPDNFVLGPHEVKSVHYFMNIPSSLEHGNYSSNITITYLKYRKIFK